MLGILNEYKSLDFCDILFEQDMQVALKREYLSLYKLLENSRLSIKWKISDGSVEEQNNWFFS